jgi:tRNA nucleotidyltransferase/poly(A) polymerase
MPGHRFCDTGDGPALAEAINAALGNPPSNLSIFKTFGTALIRFEDWDLEFVGARKESYSADSRKPSVSKGTLQDDQLRRDFTINALAFAIGGDHAYSIIDPFNGLQDLEWKRIVTPLDPEKHFPMTHCA